jgi:hypothetical protein
MILISFCLVLDNAIRRRGLFVVVPFHFYFYGRVRVRTTGIVDHGIILLDLAYLARGTARSASSHADNPDPGSYASKKSKNKACPARTKQEKYDTTPRHQRRRDIPRSVYAKREILEQQSKIINNTNRLIVLIVLFYFSAAVVATVQ